MHKNNFTKKLSYIFGALVFCVCAYATPIHAVTPTSGPTEAEIQASYERKIKAAEEAAKKAGEAVDAAVEKITPAEASQANLYNTGAGSDADKRGQIAKNTAGAIGCLGANILAQIISSTIYSLISQGLNALIGAATNVLSGLPVAEKGEAGAYIRADGQAKTGTFLSVSIGGFGGAALVLPSWDSVAYCLANAMINYIADSTIAWVNGGFEGNPAFINNPEQFFKDLANVEASSFLQGLAYGAVGLNLCEPFRAQLVLTIARSHLADQYGGGGTGGYSRGGFGEGASVPGSGGGYGGCTLDDIEGNFKGFLHGDFARGGWNSWFKVTQVEANNPYTAYFNLQAQLRGSINKKKTIVNKELDWGKGFLSFKKCEPGTEEKDKVNCKITTPGTVIETQLAKTLGLAKDRLVLAERFDQVIAVIVDKLINTALDKVFEVLTE